MATDRLETAAITGTSLAAYLLLSQDTLYGVDGQGIVRSLASGTGGHYLHVLFMPLLRAAGALLAPLGLGPYRTAVVVSAIGTAVGVGACHRAAVRLGCDRGRAALTAGLVATAPAVVFFATVVEFHGLFFAFAGLAWWACALLIRRPRVGSAMVLGVMTCLAALVHGTGQLLGLLLPLWTVASTPSRRGVTLAAVAVLAHALTFAVVTWIARIPSGNQAAFWQLYLDDVAAPGVALHTLWSEWLLAFAPLSVAWLAAARDRHALPFAVGLACYLAMSFLLIQNGSERGAYLLPLATGAALLTAGALPRRITLGVIVLALGVAVWRVEAHDTERGPSRYVAGLRAATRVESSVFLMGSLDEVNPIVRLAPEVVYEPFYDWLQLMQDSPRAEAAAFDGFEAWLRGQLAAGKSVYLTAAAHAMLAGTQAPPVGRRLLARVRARYAITRIEHGGFVAFRLDPRR